MLPVLFTRCLRAATVVTVAMDSPEVMGGTVAKALAEIVAGMVVVEEAALMVAVAVTVEAAKDLAHLAKVVKVARAMAAKTAHVGKTASKRS